MEPVFIAQEKKGNILTYYLEHVFLTWQHSYSSHSE